MQLVMGISYATWRISAGIGAYTCRMNREGLKKGKGAIADAEGHLIANSWKIVLRSLEASFQLSLTIFLRA